MSKVALVLEGGGMRGAYTAGVLSWLIENNLIADSVVGISSGAMYGSFYCLKDKELLKKAAIEIAPNKNNVGIRALLKEGQIVAYDRLYDQELVKAGFDAPKLVNSESQLNIGVYDLEKYDTIWKNQYDVSKEIKWIKAACALPIFGRFVKIQDKLYTDGGITTMIPIRKAMSEEGVDRFLVVTTKSPEYVREPLPKWQKWLLNTIVYRKHKKLVSDIDSRKDVYYGERELVNQLVTEEKAVYLYPTQETGVSRYSGTKAQFEALFDLAYQNCEEKRASIEALFQKP